MVISSRVIEGEIMKIKEIDNGYLIEADEEIEIYNNHNIKSEIFNLIDLGINNIVIDLSKVKYIDSSGLGVLISALKKLKQIGGKLILLAPTKEIQEILKLTNLSKVFLIVGSMDDVGINLK